jgi:hypothetical protein
MTPQGPSSRLLVFVGDRRGDRRPRDLHDPNGLHATACLFGSDRKGVAPILALIRRAIPAPSHPAIPVPRSEPSTCPPRNIRDPASPRAARLAMAAERLRYKRPPVLEPSLSAQRRTKSPRSNSSSFCISSRPLFACKRTSCFGVRPPQRLAQKPCCKRFGRYDRSRDTNSRNPFGASLSRPAQSRPPRSSGRHMHQAGAVE